MTQTIFNIQNLYCGYQPGKPVLKIPDLQLPKGKLIFIIGKSGIGKSTLLETLGLMNQTIFPATESKASFLPAGNAAYDLADCWQLPNNKIAAIRHQYFSFIFQTTNLMPNFTSGQNMAASLLISGVSFSTAKKKILNIMQQLSLPASIFDKRVVEVSGGQRQRIAFARAITADFEVLFGDEPTGNLDENTAIELMKVLKNILQEKGKTGILVSHDLQLAAAFGDMIIPLEAEKTESQSAFGVLRKQNIIQRNKAGWQKIDGTNIAHPIQFLNQFLV